MIEESKSLDQEAHNVPSDETKTTNGQKVDSSGAAFRVSRTEHETLQKKFVEESLERKRLYNEVIELTGNIRVFCKCRPLNQDEIASGTSSIVDVDPSRETELHIFTSDSNKKQFKFNLVFGPQDNQELLIQETPSSVADNKIQNISSLDMEQETDPITG